MPSWLGGRVQPDDCPQCSRPVERELNYRVHARTECGTCHNPWVERETTVFGVQSASPLGVNTAQLNRKCSDPRRLGQSARQVASGGLAGLDADLATLPKLVTPTTSRAISIAGLGRTCKRTVPTVIRSTRAAPPRSCSATSQPLEQTRTVNVRPIQGTFNIAGARIIAPGDPASSGSYYRMSKLGGGRMPRVGSNVVDERATRMIHDWIARMPPAPGRRPADAGEKTATARS